jgi:hypothetical protein
MAEDPTYRVKIACQIHWKGRCRRAGVYHAKGFLQLLGIPWEKFTARLERQLKRRGWQWSDYGSEFVIDHKIPVCAWNLPKSGGKGHVHALG